jgi:hypothetical protein
VPLDRGEDRDRADPSRFSISSAFGSQMLENGPVTKNGMTIATL